MIVILSNRLEQVTWGRELSRVNGKKVLQAGVKTRYFLQESCMTSRQKDTTSASSAVAAALGEKMDDDPWPPNKTTQCSTNAGIVLLGIALISRV